jgi:hypothetical protein
MKIINILGTPYTFKVDDLNNEELAINDGICRIYDKEIIVRATEYMSGSTEQSRQYRADHVIRHELVHAVAQECGVQYGDNENLVDWIAHIIPIVNKAFDELKELGD